MTDSLYRCECGEEFFNLANVADLPTQICPACGVMGRGEYIEEICGHCNNTGKVYVRDEDGGYTDVCTFCDTAFKNEEN